MKKKVVATTRMLTRGGAPPHSQIAARGNKLGTGEKKEAGLRQFGLREKGMGKMSFFKRREEKKEGGGG